MICKKCGVTLDDDALFCTECGTKVEQIVEEVNEIVNSKDDEVVDENKQETESVIPEDTTVVGEQPVEKEISAIASEQPKEKPNAQQIIKYVLMGIMAVAAVLVLLVIGKFVMSVLNRDKMMPDAAMKVWSDAGEESSYIYNNKGNILLATDEGISKTVYSGDGLVIAFISDDDLYVVNQMKSVEKVDEDVLGMQIAYDGSAVAYIVADEENYGDLYVYNVKSQKKTSIASDVYNRNIVLSVDGKQIAYQGDYNDKKDESTLFFGKVGGKITEIEDDAEAVLIGNGKLLYCDSKSKLQMYNGKNSVKIESDFYASKIITNVDHTEVIYTKNDATYIYKMGEADATKITKDASASVNAYGVSKLQLQSSTSNVTVGVVTYGFSTFKNRLIYTAGTLYRINKKGDGTDKVVSDGSTIYANPTTDSIVLVDGTKIKKINNYKKNLESEKVVTVKKLYDFAVSGNHKEMYALNDEGELYYIKRSGNKEPELVEISDDADAIEYSDKMNSVIYLEDDELYFAKKTSKSVVKIADDVHRFWVMDGTVYYEITDDKDDYELYTVDAKGNPKKLN